MPKYLVTMNVVEAKTTSFVIQANNESDVFDGLSELESDYFEKNCQWITLEYEPPTIESVEVTKKGLGFCDSNKNKRIQSKFNKIIKEFDRLEAEENE